MTTTLRCLVALVIAGIAALPAQSACRQALALGLDVSGSVDRHEYQLQLGGLANALEHPDVVNALLATPEQPVALLVYEWSGPHYQVVLLPWTTIEDRQVIAQIAAQLRAMRIRVEVDSWVKNPTTAIGAAMKFGVAQLATQPCDLRALDLSGDGNSNAGPRPRDVKPELQTSGITINTLAIAPDVPAADSLNADGEYWLTEYFKAEVIMGPGAFSETAFGFKDFERAMIRKLLREIKAISLSALDPYQ